ncbi:MAG: bifunctional [glutamate--ammonia ligase]-adenylyl-L-tyrosine phosphorylase/[glutamate--ammonia-ligase] adenylyltransferase, partial [Deltaproteobacteria bacterium]|nr:bifunctional [glutamate--ammonia ligase]-adenylyl-L-tyrosine phosphorylase/[glutamate--ammonia-ligase] adenylyltransferase [Deltaproteobacteria bacterium]
LELYLHSDLDLIFVYSRNGETQGRKSISNREYFAKLAQRIISYLSLPTREGFAYKVDTELRPSGNAGTLVTSLDSWITYYHEHAAQWERQALLKARLIFASGSFGREFQGLFRRLVFIKPFGEDLPKEIHHLRMRIEKELAKETERRWHYKKGFGGLLDIEFTVQYLQMKLGKVFDNLLSPNTLEALSRLERRGILPADQIATLKRAYAFYRMLEIYLEAKYDFKEGYLDPNHDVLSDLAARMTFASREELLEAFSECRRKVREIYLKTLKIQEA